MYNFLNKYVPAITGFSAVTLIAFVAFAIGRAIIAEFPNLLLLTVTSHGVFPVLVAILAAGGFYMYLSGQLDNG